MAFLIPEVPSTTRVGTWGESALQWIIHKLLISVIMMVCIRNHDRTQMDIWGLVGKWEWDERFLHFLTGVIGEYRRHNIMDV